MNLWKCSRNTRRHAHVNTQTSPTPPGSEALQSLSLSNCLLIHCRGVRIQKCRANAACTQLWGVAGFISRRRETLESGKDPRFKSWALKALEWNWGKKKRVWGSRCRCGMRDRQGGIVWKAGALHTENKTDMTQTSEGNRKKSREMGREVGREWLFAAEVKQFVNECNKSNWY